MIAGDLVVERVNDGCRITQADPYILISDDFMREIRKGPPLGVRAWVKADEDVLTFTDSFGARFIYRLTGARDTYGAWYAEWPD